MDYNEIYKQIDLPVFQNKTYINADEAKKAITGNVTLAQDTLTGLVKNIDFDHTLLDYDSNYQNEQAFSSAFQTHLDHVLEIIKRNVTINQLGIEVGCGKGHFLSILENAGYKITGYDPAYEGKKTNIIKKYFGNDETTNKPDYIILRHVLEHINNPFNFLYKLSMCSNKDTVIYIEVPCFDWIIEKAAFYDIFYEHVNYFNMEVLKHAFTNVIESGKLFGGQYLYIVASLPTFNTPTNYNGRVYKPLNLNTNIENLVAQIKAKSGKLLIWGAGAKGNTFANILKTRSIKIDAIIDINPAKQDRFAGLSATPIISPDKAKNLFDGCDIFVMNPVYLDEIKKMAGNFDINWIKVV
ncbi:methyltransferase domain-containing protein [Myxococcota bacterium]|nr:methyltransferase domain-containing protein [Myxococcota bacterium]MBU1381414.1 methyltransferase domain-containing protein [Myxococcota bacterium]MBU1498891.1 methyltransferase domain-containing protein [Myxococcota bacterium]